MAYWELADLEARIGPETVRQILDDNASGAVDASEIVWLQEFSDGYVNSELEPVHGTVPWTTAPAAVKRLSLDVAEWKVAQRFPAYYRKNWEKMKDVTDKDIQRIRTALSSLGDSSLTPAANTGGFVGSGDPDCPEPQDKFFIDGAADF